MGGGGRRGGGGGSRGAGGQGGGQRAGGGEATPQAQPARPPESSPPGESTETETEGQRAEPRRFPGGGFGGRPVPPGMYRVVLSVDGQDYTQDLRVEADPSAPNGVIIADEDEEDDGR
jgi:hypothetical protein